VISAIVRAINEEEAVFGALEGESRGARNRRRSGCAVVELTPGSVKFNTDVIERGGHQIVRLQAIQISHLH
jgi:hypothetical protein